MDVDRIMRQEFRPLFRDRVAAGDALARPLDRYRGQQGGRPLVIGIPRGGVPVAAEVVCLYELDPSWAVGLYYQRFEPTEDAEVTRILQDWYVGGQPKVGAV